MVENSRKGKKYAKRISKEAYNDKDQGKRHL